MNCKNHQQTSDRLNTRGASDTTKKNENLQSGSQRKAQTKDFQTTPGCYHEAMGLTEKENQPVQCKTAPKSACDTTTLEKA